MKGCTSHVNGNAFLVNGDCFEAMSGLAPGLFDLILVDPPYGTTALEWDKPLPFDRLWAEYDRILAPNGVVVMFAGMPFSALAVCSNLKWFKQSLVWDKNKCGSPGLANKRVMQTHEDILIFSKAPLGKAWYFPQMEEGEPYSRKTNKEGGYVGRENNHGYGMKPRSEFSNEGTRYPKSVRRVSRDFSAQQQVHPTQKPVPLLRWLVRTYSPEGGCVLDNVMGSGSSGIAALCEERRFFGIEKDADYFEIACERIGSVGQC